ncbi:hypothetical protein [Flavitalea sp.]|nr:DUF3823 domain-containing protein [Flavitalea sp.]
MKIIFFFAVIISFTSCSVDNYEMPNLSIAGKIVDSQNGELVESGGVNAGTVVRLYEGGSAQPINLTTFPEGNFINSRMFPGDYSYTAVGPFVLTSAAPQSLVINNNNTEIEIKVMPHVRLKATLVSNTGTTAVIKLGYTKVNASQPLTELGVLWSTLRNPNNLTFSGGGRTLDNVLSQNLSSGEKTYTIQNLKPGTTYYLRGIGRTTNPGSYFNYSSQIEFKIQ